MVSRYECLQSLAEIIGDALVVLSPSGMRNEWHAIRPHPPTLRLAMGTTTPLALGLALALPNRRVVALDTDGGLLMNLSALTTVGNLKPPNLTVIVMDNECYESIGGFPTVTAALTDLEAMARGTGVEKSQTTRTLEEFQQAAKEALEDKQNFHLIVAKVDKGVKVVPPVPIDGIETKYRFARYIEETENIQILTASAQKIPKHLLRK